MSKIYTSADQLIGGTPLLELTNMEKSEKLSAKVLAKAGGFTFEMISYDPATGAAEYCFTA